MRCAGGREVGRSSAACSVQWEGPCDLVTAENTEELLQ